MIHGSREKEKAKKRGDEATKDGGRSEGGKERELLKWIKRTSCRGRRGEREREREMGGCC